MTWKYLATFRGFAQASLSAVASTANTTVSGTKAVSTAGSDELLSSMQLKKGDFGSITTTSAGTHSIPLAPRLPGASALPTATASPNMVIARMSRLLDTQFVDKDGRWLVVSPHFMEVLMDEDSRLLKFKTLVSRVLFATAWLLTTYMASGFMFLTTFRQLVLVRVLQVLLTRTLTMA